MSVAQNVAVRGTESAEPKDQGELQARREQQERVLVPAVDIFEDSHRITVKADVPGITKEGLSIQADRNSLLIEGKIELDLPQNMDAVYADLRATKYRRSFVLSGELDTERIDANLKDGILTICIPKREEYQPRKIKVKVG